MPLIRFDMAKSMKSQTQMFNHFRATLKYF